MAEPVTLVSKTIPFSFLSPPRAAATSACWPSSARRHGRTIFSMSRLRSAGSPSVLPSCSVFADKKLSVVAVHLDLVRLRVGLEG